MLPYLVSNMRDIRLPYNSISYHIFMCYMVGFNIIYYNLDNIRDCYGSW